ncbi:hypothetical protein [Mangrovihabitans endophyticus]|uniref:Uncharacterized protein n=1 Tax=Mangrovihabitans endophyticus TaxID=1751298 RepID=A0A8J3FP31_9ACTN|nr:hypothetical protein [Mangrovihabitans endophyticus]GGK92440.1 hypothetical protein GCM10012284_27800 [Mangrovihabitans endophyticus]
MIVVVEGPTAAGKTTWCRRHVGRFVAGYARTGKEPADGPALARHWARVAMRRWAEAEELERLDGVAFCDTDPIRLHYAWGMAALGLAPRAQFDRELAVVRVAMQTGRLGFADAVLVGLPDVATLQRRRDEDPTRRRRNFATHVQLREPLRQWYATLDALDPGRVHWDLPTDGTPKLPEPRPERSSVALLDALVEALPPLRTAVPE